MSDDPLRYGAVMQKQNPIYCVHCKDNCCWNN